MSDRNTLLIVRKPPFGSSDSWEALRLALSFYAGRSPISIVLEGPGVLNWVSGMASEAESTQSVQRFVDDIGRFGIPVYVIEEDLAENGLTVGDLASQHLSMIRRSRLGQMLIEYDMVVAV